MKKLFLLIATAMMAVSSFAQEEFTLGAPTLSGADYCLPATVTFLKNWGMLRLTTKNISTSDSGYKGIRIHYSNFNANSGQIKFAESVTGQPKKEQELSGSGEDYFEFTPNLTVQSWQFGLQTSKAGASLVVESVKLIKYDDTEEDSSIKAPDAENSRVDCYDYIFKGDWNQLTWGINPPESYAACFSESEVYGYKANFTSIENKARLQFVTIILDSEKKEADKDFRSLENLAEDATSFSFDITNPHFKLKVQSNRANANPSVINDLSVAYTINARISISAAGYATYCSKHDLDFTNVTSIEAYTATVEGDQIRFSPVTGKVAAGTGLLLKSKNGGAVSNVKVPVDTRDVPTLTSDLTGVLAETQESAGIYVLMDGVNGVGFYRTTGDFTVRAHSAYIKLPSASKAFFALNDETTGIAQVENVKNNAVYNLAGQRVQNPTKGMYIVNGKKVVLK